MRCRDLERCRRRGDIHRSGLGSARSAGVDRLWRYPIYAVRRDNGQFADGAARLDREDRRRKSRGHLYQRRPAVSRHARDYAVYRTETQVWRDKHLRVYPALGNHELSACLESICLDRWWNAFPELQGRRWYSVALGSKVIGIALDSDASLFPGSEQRMWLETQVSALDPKVRVVLMVMHHPPVADVQTVKLVDHNARPNEQALAAYLKAAAAHSSAASWSALGTFTITSGSRRTGSHTWFPAAGARCPTRWTALLRTCIKTRISRTIISCASNCAGRL